MRYFLIFSTLFVVGLIIFLYLQQDFRPTLTPQVEFPPYAAEEGLDVKAPSAQKEAGPLALRAPAPPQAAPQALAKSPDLKKGARAAVPGKPSRAVPAADSALLRQQAAEAEQMQTEPFDNLVSEMDWPSKGAPPQNPAIPGPGGENPPEGGGSTFSGGISAGGAMLAPPPTPEQMMKEIVTEEEKKRVMEWKEEKLKEHEAKVEKNVQEYYQSFDFRLIGKWRSAKNGYIKFYKDGTGYIYSPVVSSDALALSGRYYFRYKLDKNIITLIPILTKGAEGKIIAYYMLQVRGDRLKVGPVQYTRDNTE